MDHPQLFSTGPGPKPKITKTKRAELETVRTWRARNPDRVKKLTTDYRRRFPDRVKASQLRARQRNLALYRQRERERYAAKSFEERTAYNRNPVRRQQERDRYLRRTYGIRLADEEALRVWQGDRCASFGCRIRPARDRWDTHHDHDTGQVVALLCNPHNTLEGMLLKAGPLDLRGW
jgi:hypothetical protein